MTTMTVMKMINSMYLIQRSMFNLMVLHQYAVTCQIILCIGLKSNHLVFQSKAQHMLSKIMEAAVLKDIKVSLELMKKFAQKK